MAVGKTTLGKQLAKVLSIPFKDTDALVVKRTGADIPWIFDVEGEQGFRNRETQILSECSKEKELLLATGGGIVLSEKNRNTLKSQFTTVYLSASIQRLLERTAKDKNRPLLNVPNRREVLESIIQERHPLYLSCCDLHIVTDDHLPSNIVNVIINGIKSL